MNTKYLFMGVTFFSLVGLGVFVLREQKPSSSSEEAVVAVGISTDQAEKSNLVERYSDYSETRLAQATKNDGKAVIFFAALGWCPSCQAADRDLKANFDKVPHDVTVLRADFDTATELKQKYAITMQDTFVQVDANGKEITRWNSGGQGVQALLANAK